MPQSIPNRNTMSKTYSRRTSTVIDESRKRLRNENISTVEYFNSKNRSPNIKKNLLGSPGTPTTIDIRNFFRSISPSGLESPSPTTSSPNPLTVRNKRRLRFITSDKSNSSHKSSRCHESSTRLVQQTIASIDKELLSCKVCGMVYTFWEEKSHSRFHRQLNSEYIPLIKSKKATFYEREFESKTLCIQVVDRNTEKSLRSLGERALQFSSDNGLEMEPIDSKFLWGLITNPHDQRDPDPVLHYKLYTMFHELKLVALLLAERIGYAGHTNKTTLPAYDHANMQNKNKTTWKIKHDDLFNQRQKVFMSVERIWVRQEYQNKGLATLILDKARENFLHPISLPKHKVAISWPTEDGARFLKKYFYGIFSPLDIDNPIPYLINLIDTTPLGLHEKGKNSSPPL